MLQKKKLIIIHADDKSMCSVLRQHAITQVCSSGRTYGVEFLVTPEVVRDEYLLKYTIAVVVGRPMNERSCSIVEHYGRLKRRFGFRVIVDYDDVLWDVGGHSLLPSYNGNKLDPVAIGKRIEGVLHHVDEVTVSTQYLGMCWLMRFGEQVKVTHLPNLLPRMYYGHRVRDAAPAGKPVVVYGGSMTHFSEDDPGDFAGPWIPWLDKCLADDRIELHMFGSVPSWLQQHKERIVTHHYVPAAVWGSTLRDINCDIFIAPLAESPFNSAKSELKLLEASACGMAFMGSHWENGPYGRAHQLSMVDNSWSPDRLMSAFDDVLANFLDITHYQDDLIEHNYLEHQSNVMGVLDIYCRGLLDGEIPADSK